MNGFKHLLCSLFSFVKDDSFPLKCLRDAGAQERQMWVAVCLLFALQVLVQVHARHPTSFICREAHQSVPIRQVEGDYKVLILGGVDLQSSSFISGDDLTSFDIKVRHMDPVFQFS